MSLRLWYLGVVAVGYIDIYFLTPLMLCVSNSFPLLQPGIAASSGSVWSTSRKFALRHLRDFGMGKSKLETTVSTEVKALTQALEKTSGQPTELSWNLNVAVLNIIWHIVASKYSDTFSLIASSTRPKNH